MSERKRYGSGAAAVVLLVLLVGLPAVKAEIIPLGLPELADRCEHAVVGTVVGLESYWNPELTQIYTDVRIRVEEDLKGNFSGPDGLLVLTEPGGTVAETTILVEHTPEFNVGERVLIFTERTPDNRLIVLGRDLAKFTLTPASGWALDEAGQRVDDGTGAPAGTITFSEPGRDLLAEVRSMMVGRGWKPVHVASAPAAPEEASGARGPAVPLYELTPGSIVPEGDDATDGDRACSGQLVYSVGTEVSSLYVPGANVIIADDETFVGNVGCPVTCFTFGIGCTTAGTYTVQVALYSDCPGAGGVQLTNWLSWTNQSFSVGWYTLQVTAGGAGIPTSGTVWLAMQFNTGNLGVRIGGAATTGYTADRFYSSSDSSCYHYFGGSPYAGFTCSMYCAGATEPTLSTVSPGTAPAGVGAAGPSGSLVTITGSGFGAKGAGDHVAFWRYNAGGMDWYAYNDAYIVSWSDTQITCYVPGAASSKDCAVVKNGTWSSNKPTFTVPWSYWYRWKDQSVMPLTYYVNTNSIPGVTLASTQASLQTWEDVTDDYLDHNYLGTSDRNGSNHNDGYNDIAWRSSGWAYGPNVIAVTTVRQTNGVIAETDMELNAQNWTWSSSGEAGRMDVQNVVTHEAGHGWAGLRDLYGVPDAEKTMYYMSSTGEIKKQSLEPGDSAGCQWIYAVGYCPAWATIYDEYVARVQVESIDNATSSTPGGYANYTAQVCNMTIGTGYSIAVTNGIPYDGDRCGIWVDWNQDGDFADANETITVSGGPASFSATITPPADALTGNTRLRVRILYDPNSSPLVTPCGQSAYGEVEDYTANVICTTAPDSAASDRDNFCADDTGNISLSVSGGAGATVHWFDDSCGSNEIGIGNPLVIASPTQTTTYYGRWENVCGVSGCAQVTVTVRPLPTAPTSASVNRDWFCPDDAGQISLTASDGTGDTLAWYAGGCGGGGGGGAYVGSGSPLSIDSPAATTTYYARWENTCGDSACASVTVHVDTTGPTFTGIPDDVTVYCDAGTCFATDVSIGQATASDDHNGVASIVATLLNGNPLPTEWSPGVYQIKWTATDGCGNVTVDDTTQQVTVLDENQLVVDVQLRGMPAGEVTRCITFTLFDCGGTPVIVKEALAFSNGLSSGAVLTVACGDYDCLLAQDELHTLARRLERGLGGLDVSNKQYTASFTGDSHNLIGGDIGGAPEGGTDNVIDIVDFGVYIAEWGWFGSGSTTCTTAWPHADINGSGGIDVGDYGFITTNFLASGDECCGRGARGEARRSITVAELRRLGLEKLSAADLNHDGVLDQADVELFLNGLQAPAPHVHDGRTPQDSGGKKSAGGSGVAGSRRRP